jgi:hypothetical protein
VRKGPGSKPSKHERLKAASRTNRGAWDKSPAMQGKDKGRGKAAGKGKPGSAKKQSARKQAPNLSKKARSKQGPKRSGR